MNDIRIDVNDRYNIGVYGLRIQIGEAELNLGSFTGQSAKEMAQMLYDAAMEMGHTGPEE